MNRIRKQLLLRNGQTIIVILLIAVVVLFVVMSQLFILHYFKKHSIDDLKSASAFQAELVNDQITHEIETLSSLEKYMESGFDFFNPNNVNELENYVEYNKLCMLAYVDIDGNAVSYRGEDMGNVSDRRYYSDIVNEKMTSVCQYLPNPKGNDSPRVIISVPVYDNGVLSGVLFESKEIRIVEERLFSNSFLTEADIIIFDGENQSIICSKNGSYDEILLIDESTENTILSKALNTNSNCELEVGSTKISGTNYIYSCVKLDNDINWYLVCITDRDVALNVYGGTLSDIAYFIYLIIVAFSVVCVYCIYILEIQINKEKQEECKYNSLLDSYRQLFEQMDCAVVEYDVEKDELSSSDSYERIFKGEKLSGGIKTLEVLQNLHHEFGFDELFAEMKLVTETMKPTSFETILNCDDNSTIWINIVLLPIQNAKGTVSRIFAAVQDITSQHKLLESATNLVNQVPGGIHRCYLSDPIHLEYASDGLLKLLGYSEEEFDDVIGDERNFCNCIFMDDRQTFEDFCTNLAKNGGTDTCEYRLIDKSGNLVYVADTMDVKRASSGTMYGYSIVTNITDYLVRESAMKQELKSANEALDMARLRISTGQMQPHFLYNSLASIREIILEDPERASDLICDFTTHLRACIRSMRTDELIPFSQELNNIRAYVNIERMRFGDRLLVEYDIGVSDFKIIPLGIQPLVENAIRHGIYERGQSGGIVWIRTKAIEDGVEITIEDNGTGFDFEQINQEIETGKRDSTGLLNLIYRFEEVMGAEVIIESIVGEGTKITVLIHEEEMQ